MSIKRFHFLIAVTLVLLLAGCGGQSQGTIQVNLMSIQISPSNPSVAAGLTQQFKATGQFSDGSTKDLTTAAAWISSDTAAANISAPGLAAAKAQGTATVSATYSNVTGKTLLTVAPAALVSIAVAPPSASIAANTSTSFRANGTFTDGSTQDVTSTASWSSSSATVANVSDTIPTEGTAKGLTPGSSTITASSGKISGSASLTVTNAALTTIAISPNSLSIPLGVLQPFTATGSFTDGTTQDITASVNWSSSAPTVASITKSGLATATNLGNTVISASSGAVNNNVSLNVNAANIASLSINPGNGSIAQTTSQQFEAVGTFNDGGTRALTSQATWSSSDTTVATIGATTGRAKGVAPGLVTITATLGSVSASAPFTVTNANVVSMTVIPSGRTIAAGTKQNFSATGSFSDGTSQLVTNDATWSSDNTAVATVFATNGTATGVATGTANISATLNGVSGSAPLNVSPATLVSIAVNPATAVLAPASGLNYSAIGTYSDGTTQNISGVVTWSTSDATVASITGSGGTTGQSAGAVTITAQLGGISNSANLIVEATALNSIAITPATATIPAQINTQFNATGTFLDGSTQNLTNAATWTSSPASVATVGDTGGTKGRATGVAAGNATVTAVFAGVVGTASLQVTNATLTSITISPSAASIALGSSQQFTATGKFSDGSTINLSSQATWKSSNVNVAVIGAGGNATSAGTGSTTITALLNGVSSSTTLTVH
ncbi:MAG TPA: Ig-like domain-containing protein [Candidatus Acidoferrales bacterium]|nr:Ig-like domain-containing protein [Candidatus Acidoferrales bacterium]